MTWQLALVLLGTGCRPLLIPGLALVPSEHFYLLSKLWKVTGRGADGEGDRPTKTAAKVQARCSKGRKDRRRYLKSYSMLRSSIPAIDANALPLKRDSLD